MVSLSQVLAVAILGAESERIAVKYYKNAASCPLLNSHKKQLELESELSNRASRLPNKSEVEALAVDSLCVLVKSIGNNINVFLIGASTENELILSEVLDTICQSIDLCINGSLTQQSLQTNLDTLFLILDETIDEGIIFETDPETIAARVQSMDKLRIFSGDNNAFNQAIANAKENLLRGFLNSS